ncbi:hypothetical protein G8759_22050 [Spirosoma aureum]|uniref:Cation-transporting P-type ATPase N-terminal domain-containing protein n=1 Tax=Spirosoma aureum TaxID=2692134 RepID=A0A6G9ASC1_9BACT|nr:cation-transporting P-type ATPase [Spirosoma aureum]QIP15113.1 hypothetical protein G8759_22050 [Spirosoma aureum]
MTNPSSLPLHSALSDAQGLSTAEAKRRLSEKGPNAVETIQTEHWLTVFVRQLKSLIVWGS